jgi:hypothetical protein
MSDAPQVLSSAQPVVTGDHDETIERTLLQDKNAQQATPEEATKLTLR